MSSTPVSTKVNEQSTDSSVAVQNQTPTEARTQNVAQPTLQSEQTPSQPPPKGVGAWFKQKVWGGVTKAVSTGVTKALSTKVGAAVATRYVGLGNKDVSEQTTHLSPMLLSTIEDLAPLLARQLVEEEGEKKEGASQKKGAQEDSTAILRGLYKQQPQAIVKAIKATLVFALGNLLKATPPSQGKTPSLPDIVTHISRLLQEQHQKLKPGLETSSVRNAHLPSLFDPVLKIAFPNGERDLPVGNAFGGFANIQGLIWGKITDPERLACLYDWMTSNTHLTDWFASVPETTSSGEKPAERQVIEAVCDFATDKVIAHAFPSLLTPEIVDALAKEANDSIQSRIATKYPKLTAGLDKLQQHSMAWMKDFINGTVKSNPTPLTERGLKELSALVPEWFKEHSEKLPQLENALRLALSESLSQSTPFSMESVIKAVPSLNDRMTPAKIQAFEKEMQGLILSQNNAQPDAQRIWKYARAQVRQSLENIFNPPEGKPRTLAGLYEELVKHAHTNLSIIWDKEVALNGAQTEEERTKIKGEIDAQFELFATDILMLGGLDKDKKLGLFYPSIRAQLTRKLKETIYPSLKKAIVVQPGTKQNLREALFRKEHYLSTKISADAFLQGMSNLNTLSSDQQQLLWQASGTNHTADTIERLSKEVLAPGIRKALREYLQTEHAALSINESLGLKLDAAGCVELQKQLQLMAQGGQIAWEHLEKLFYDPLLKMFVNIMRQAHQNKNLGDAQPLAKLLPHLTVDLIEWIDTSLTTQQADQPSAVALINRIQTLQKQRQRPQELLQQIQLLEMKIQQNIFVFRAKMKASHEAVSALPSNRHSQQTSMTQAMQTEHQQTLKTFEKELKQLQEAMTAAEQENKKIDCEAEIKKVQEQLRTCLLLLSKTLINKFGDDVTQSTHPLHNIPLPESLKKRIWNEMFPHILSSFLMQQHSALVQDPSTLQEDTNLIFSGQSLGQMGDLLKNYSAAFIQHAVANDPTLCERLFDLVTGLLPDQFKTYFQEHRKELIGILANNAQSIGTNQNPAMKRFWSVVAHNCHFLVLKTLSATSKYMFLAQNDPNTLPKQSIKIMERIGGHIQAISAVGKQCNVSHVYKVKPQEMLQRMQQMQIKNPTKEILHPALQKMFETDPTTGQTRQLTADEAFKKQMRAFSDRTLKLAGITQSNFPNPQTFKLAQEVVGPMLFETLCNQATSEKSRSNYFLSLVTNLQGITHSMETFFLEEYSPQHSPQMSQRTDAEKSLTRFWKMILELLRWFRKSIVTRVDEPQTKQVAARKDHPASDKELENTKHAMGKMVEKAVHLVPRTMLHALMNNVKDVKKMTADQLGNATFEYAKQKHVVTDFLLPFVQTMSTHLHPGQWKGDLFTTPSTATLPDGSVKNQWNFSLQSSPTDAAKERAAINAIKSQTASRARSAINDGFDLTILKTIAHVRQKTWEVVAKIIENVTDAIFKAKTARALQIILKSLFALVHSVIFLAIYALGVILYIPYWIATRLHIANQVSGLEKTAAMDIHRSLFLYLIDDQLTHMERVKEQHNKQQSEAPLSDQWRTSNQNCAQLLQDFSRIGTNTPSAVAAS